MRIAQLIQYLDIGGLERMALALSDDLVRRGHEVHVASYLGDEDGPMRAMFEASNVSVTALGSGDGFDMGLVGRLAQWLEDTGAEVLHTHHLGPFIYGRAAAAIAGIPVVHTEHSHEFYDTPRRQLAGAAMAPLAYVTAVSQEIAQWRSKHLGTPVCAVIPNGVPVPPRDWSRRAIARDLIGLDHTNVVLGCVARLAPEKDHATLIDAFSAARGACPELHLVLVGDGSERASLEAKVQAMNLAEHVDFLGSRKDVERLLPAFDFTALTSTREGLPLALLEAMAFGIPVVATAVGGIPELLSHGGGLLARPGDVAGIADALISYATMPARRASDGQAARHTVATDHGAGVMAQRYVNIYRRALVESAHTLEEAA